METIRNKGKIKTINNIHIGKGTSEATDLIESIFKGFIDQSYKYIIATEEAPFTYNERQLNSIISPAISKITNAFLMEHPINRHRAKKGTLKGQNINGRIDYWCLHEGFNFFIELKHDYCSYNTKIIRESSFQKWHNANYIQLSAISKDASELSENSRGAIRIALHIITVYDNLRKDIRRDSIKDAKILHKIHRKHLDTLDPEPDWSGLWIMHEELVKKSYDEYDASKDYYPGVLMVAKVYEKI